MDRGRRARPGQGAGAPRTQRHRPHARRRYRQDYGEALSSHVGIHVAGTGGGSLQAAARRAGSRGSARRGRRDQGEPRREPRFRNRPFARGTAWRAIALQITGGLRLGGRAELAAPADYRRAGHSNPRPLSSGAAAARFRRAPPITQPAPRVRRSPSPRLAALRPCASRRPPTRRRDRAPCCAGSSHHSN